MIKEDIRCLVFLGNPGTRYAHSRHNLAWRVADVVTASGYLQSSVGWINRFNGQYGQTEELRLLKPQTFMNRSGDSIRSLVRFFKLKPVQVLVVHDDLELDFGQIQFRLGGGLGGHNGLRSTAAGLSTRDFWRYRLGIGRPTRGSVQSFVLSRFSSEEEISLPDFVDGAADNLITWLKSSEASPETGTKFRII